MKKAKVITVLVMLLMMGCSKDESTNDTSVNNQLKRGSVSNAGVASLSFNGKSIVGGEPYLLTDLKDGSKVVLKGKCSGSITGYGNINPTISDYSFDPPVKKDNTDYQYNSRELPYDYDLSGTGTVKLNTRDYFTFSMTMALYSPANYEPGFAGIPLDEPEFHGAMFGCPNSSYVYINNVWEIVSQGEAKITYGAGKFSTFKDRPLQVYRAIGTKSINRDTGEMNLTFTIK